MIRNRCQRMPPEVRMVVFRGEGTRRAWSWKWCCKRRRHRCRDRPDTRICLQLCMLFPLRTNLLS